MVSAFDLASWNAPQIEVLQSAQMSAVVKVVLVAVCADALVFVVLRFIVPLVAMHKAGVGVEIPLSKRIAAAHPKLAGYLFVLGGAATVCRSGSNWHLVAASTDITAMKATQFHVRIP